MLSSLFLSAAFLAASAVADVSIDVSKGAQVASQNAGVLSSITANPVFQSDVSILATAVPSSIIDALANNPQAAIEALSTASLPTDVLDSLASVAAVPIAAGEDIASYVSAAIAEPAFSSAQSVLATAVPSPLQPIIKEKPAAFLAGGITASVTPAYLSSLPTGVQSELASFINGGLHIFASDLAATGTPIARNSTATGMVTSVTASNTPMTVSTGSAAPYTGAANAVNANTIGAFSIIIGTIVIALL